jgi:hypothetical protein
MEESAHSHGVHWGVDPCCDSQGGEGEGEDDPGARGRKWTAAARRATALQKIPLMTHGTHPDVPRARTNFGRQTTISRSCTNGQLLGTVALFMLYSSWGSIACLASRGTGETATWQRLHPRSLCAASSRRVPGTVTPRAPSRGPMLRLRGGQGGHGAEDEKAADTNREHDIAHGFTRSPSPNPPANADAAATRTRSPSPEKSGTRSSSPEVGLLIAICAWESLHTIAVGGVAPHVTEIAAGLARRGNDVHLFVRAGHDMSQPRYEYIQDVHVHRVPIELNPDFVTECMNMCNAFVFFIREAEEFMHAKFDIVHAHDWLTAKTIVQVEGLGITGQS